MAVQGGLVSWFVYFLYHDVYVMRKPPRDSDAPLNALGGRVRGFVRTVQYQDEKLWTCAAFKRLG